MRPNHLECETALGGHAEFEGWFGKHHQIFGRINIQVDAQGAVEPGGTRGPFRPRSHAPWVMLRRDHVRVIKQRDFLLGVV